MQSLEELKANLAQYKAQAEQVKSLLALDPGNEQYKQLETDLANATRLTQQLIKAQTGGGGGGATGAAEASSVPTEPLQLRKEPAAAAAASSSSKPWTAQVGDRVEAPYGEKRYPAVILALDGEKAEATVKFYGYPNVESKPLSDLTPLRPAAGGELAPGQATVGFECEAVWIGDGQWYDAVVQGLVENGYKVKFTRYGNEAEVPLEHLRPRPAASAGVANAAATRPPKRPAPEGSASAVKEFVIPDHLRLLPTDSEEEKARKRKKVKHLKMQWKERHAGALEAQAEREAEQSGGGAGSWKSYLNKSKKKSATAKGLGALKKGSIFASPDTVDGRVGVVGSGQGMTDFEKRNTFTKRNVMK